MSYFDRRDVVNSVYRTSKLDVFNIIKGNRPPNPQHVRRLADSIRTNGMMQNPIIVNENLDVIDGQHRLLAAKDSSSVIYYIIMEGYGLKEVQELNINQKNWSKKDFLESYADMGLESYVKLRNFMRKNPAFLINPCIAMCSNRASGSYSSIGSKYTGDKVADIKEIFEDGTWVGRDFEIAQDSADKIMMMKTYYDGYLRSIFIGTMLSLFNNKEFDFLEFLTKLNISNSKTRGLYKCCSV